MTQFETEQYNGMNLHVLPTKRFKTYSITLYTGVPLSEDTVTATALLPFVLRRGTAKSTETLELRERLDEMYGAGFGFNVSKRGNSQIINFRMDVINDSFVSSPDSLLKGAIGYLGELITEPLIEGNSFRQSYVDAEKENLKKQLESIINDKIRYAAERCIEEMCSHDNYRLNALGKIDDLAQIDGNQLLNRYHSWLKEACLDLYVVGDTTLEEVKQFVSQAFQLQKTSDSTYKEDKVFQSKSGLKHVVDRLDVTQGKLNMGLQTNINYASPDYPALLMYNGILGSYPHSKLFINVREKESLAYYCASRLDGHKGICTIQSGIEFKHYEKAVQIIKEQLESMRQGQISELEMTQTKAMLSNALLEMNDSASEMIAFDFNNVLARTERTGEELLKQIEAISVPDIQKVAQKVELDTIYFLRNREEV